MEFLSIPQVAERLNVTPGYVRRLIFQRRLAVTKLGAGRAGKVRVAEEDVQALIERGRVEAAK